jgi:hypothetical protein
MSGLTLDGSAMIVSVESVAEPPKTVFSRLQPHLQSHVNLVQPVFYPPQGNIREGIFGTALQEQDEPQAEVQVNARRLVRVTGVVGGRGQARGRGNRDSGNRGHPSQQKGRNNEGKDIDLDDDLDNYMSQR